MSEETDTLNAIKELRERLDNYEALRTQRDALLAACKKLIDAEHQDHMAIGLSDSELAGLDAIRAAIILCEGGAP